jgi:hypothetical protein
MKSSFLFILILWCSTHSVNAQNAEINQLLDSWHRSAAQADAKVFFDAMTDSSIYIGTDASERWTKAEFYTFAKPYFDRKQAWDFKPYDRIIMATTDGEVAWFSELLTTWMGVCRGSGIVVQTPNGWRIAQYHLSVTVPNEIIGDFLKLIDNSSSSPKK